MDSRTLTLALVDKLGPSLLALTANASSPDEVEAWARGDQSPTSEQLERLQVANECFSMVEQAESAEVARAWFLGKNTGSREISPAEAVRAQEFDDVRISAQRMVNDEFMGS